MNGIKVVAIIGALVAMAASGFLALVATFEVPRYEREVPALTIESTLQRVERGRRWAGLLCVDCHQNPSTGRLTGAPMPSAARFGDIHSTNITRHATQGIGAWSDGDVEYLLRTGIARDGRYTPPWMPKWPHLADEDLAALIAFLRSDDPAVEPSDVAKVPSRLSFFAKFLLALKAFRPLPMPPSPIEAPSPSDEVAYGRYLTWNLDCWTCHSQHFAKLDFLKPEGSPGYLGGGDTASVGSDGEALRSSNLTPDEETGLGRWTPAQFVRALREGVRPDGSKVRMRTYALLTEDEARAIFTYLKTVPPLRRSGLRNP